MCGTLPRFKQSLLANSRQLGDAEQLTDTDGTLDCGACQILACSKHNLATRMTESAFVLTCWEFGSGPMVDASRAEASTSPLERLQCRAPVFCSPQRG